MNKTIKQWANIAYLNAVEHGFHDGDEKKDDAERLPIYLMNLHSEISELWESWRNGKLRAACDKSGAMIKLGLTPLSCLEEELADIVIRVFDSAEALGVDIERAVEIKHAYNVT